jgi:hypothetical protein
MRVKLSAVILSVHVKLGLIHETSDLDVSTGYEVLDTRESTSWNEASAMARRGAPSDLLLFSVTDGGVGYRRSPKAEIVNVVDHGSLTLGLLVLGGGVADVVTSLRATDGPGDVVNLVGDSRRVGVNLVDKWCWVGRVNLSESRLGSQCYDEKSGKSGARHVSKDASVQGGRRGW